MKIDINNIKRGEIYMADLPDIKGTSIQYGVRPVLVISNDKCNSNSPVIHVVPLTSRNTKSYTPTHIEIGTECGLKLDSTTLCEQSMPIQKDIMFRKIGEIDNRTMYKINIAILVQFGLMQFGLLNKIVTKYQRKHDEAICA